MSRLAGAKAAGICPSSRAEPRSAIDGKDCSSAIDGGSSRKDCRKLPVRRDRVSSAPVTMPIRLPSNGTTRLTPGRSRIGVARSLRTIKTIRSLAKICSPPRSSRPASNNRPRWAGLSVITRSTAPSLSSRAINSPALAARIEIGRFGAVSARISFKGSISWNGASSTGACAFAATGRAGAAGLVWARAGVAPRTSATAPNSRGRRAIPKRFNMLSDLSY